jgi:hypothetical protein
MKKPRPASATRRAPVAKTPAAAKNRNLPVALAERAVALGEQKKAELAARAREEIAFIHDKQTQIVASFYDIGAALNRLAEPGVAESTGHKGFIELVEAELDMSAAKARDLMSIARFVRREDALRWGQEKSAALVELAQATAAADSPATLAKKRKLALASGRVIDIEAANALALQEAAKEARAARAASEGHARTKRGVSATAAERETAKRLERALHAAGEDRARVTAVARAGGGADVRIERVAVAGLAALSRAVAAVHKKR